MNKISSLVILLLTISNCNQESMKHYSFSTTVKNDSENYIKTKLIFSSNETKKECQLDNNADDQDVFTPPHSEKQIIVTYQCVSYAGDLGYLSYSTFNSADKYNYFELYLPENILTEPLKVSQTIKFKSNLREQEIVLSEKNLEQSIGINFKEDINENLNYLGDRVLILAKDNENDMSIFLPKSSLSNPSVMDNVTEDDDYWIFSKIPKNVFQKPLNGSINKSGKVLICDNKNCKIN